MDSASFQFVLFGLAAALISNFSRSRVWRSTVLTRRRTDSDLARRELLVEGQDQPRVPMKILSRGFVAAWERSLI
jgi:hypothetical protein